jgi:lipopolysaccharide export system permease protein
MESTGAETKNLTHSGPIGVPRRPLFNLFVGMAVLYPAAIIAPMSCTFRYMLRQHLWPLLFAVVVICGIIWMSQSLRFVDLVLNRGLPANNMFYLAFLVLPMFTSVFLPIILFGVVVFVYNRMYLDSELVILRSCGKGPLSLAAPALTAAVAVMIACYALNIYYMPAAYRDFKDLQHEIRKNYSQAFLQEGAFNELGRYLTVYVRERIGKSELRGILVYDRRDRSNPVTMMAERGALVQTSSGPRVVMVDGNRQTLKKSKGELSILYFDRYTLDLGGKKSSRYRRGREPRERYIHELFDFNNSWDREGLEKRRQLKLLAEGHQRIASPLLAIAFTLMALAALLTGEFNRRGQVWRIVVVTAAMLVLLSINISLHSIVARKEAFTPLMYLFPLGAIAISLWLLLRRSRRHRSMTAPPETQG